MNKQISLAEQVLVDGSMSTAVRTSPDIWPGSDHTLARPFCEQEQCQCHFDYWHIELFFVRPIERKEIDIPQALARYRGELVEMHTGDSKGEGMKFRLKGVML